MTVEQNSYRRDIDGLRAVAVMSVIFYHCEFLLFPGGFVGVDMFFVISGYLIIGHIVQEGEKNSFCMTRFYARRAARIIPALSATILTVVAVSWLTLLPTYFVEASNAAIASAISISNVYFWRSAHYFAPSSVFQPLLQTWSLGVEEQFYIIVPIAFVALRRYVAPQRCRSISLACLCAVSIASLAISIPASYIAPTANFHLLPTRAWEIAIGGIAALTGASVIGRRVNAEVAAFSALAAILLSVLLLDSSVPFPGLFALPPCLGTAALLKLGEGHFTRATELLSIGHLRRIGLMSFSLYLIHWPIISFWHSVEVRPLTPLEVVLAIIAMMFLAALSWKFIEQPFRRAAKDWPPRMVLLSTSVMLLACCTLGVVGVGAKGFPSRYPDFVEATIPGHDQWKIGTCFLVANPDYRDWMRDQCVRVDAGGETVLLWGDSFAAQYVPGFIRHAERLKIRLIQYTAAACPPIIGYFSLAQPRCTQFNENVSRIIAENGVRTVILSARWTDVERRGLNTLKSTLSLLEKLNVRVIVIAQSPQFSADVQVLSYLKGDHSRDSVNRWSFTFSPNLNASLKVIASDVTVVDPMPVFCDMLLCTYQDRGVFLFEDYGHFSVEGSSRAVNKIFVEGISLQN